MVAHDDFDILDDGVFPAGRKVLLVENAATELRDLPSSPCEEDPNVSPYFQVLTLFRNYLAGTPMRPEKDYRCADRRNSIWKWKTRTIRLGGIYVSNPNTFIVAKLGYARAQKAGGRSSVQKERDFCFSAVERLQNIGLLNHAWRGRDPHDGEAFPFDPY